MNPEEERQRGLTRERLVEAALELIDEEGLDGLSMRALADRLGVKAASLYWHVRDRRELVELLAESILESVPRPRDGRGWRDSVIAVAEAVRRRVARQKDARRILLEVPDAIAHSEVYSEVVRHLVAAGLRRAEAADVAAVVMTAVIAGAGGADAPAERVGRGPASIAVDTGSRGVVLRAGSPDMETLIRVPRDRSAAAPAVVRGETVVVRRLRGVGLGEIELNPRRSWTFHIQAPTWNTVLDVGGLDVRDVHVDSGAAKIECFLPAPRGVVPIRISSGVASVAIHRPNGVAAVARVSSGAVKVRLDNFASRVTVSDVHWQSDGAASARDRYELEVSGGAVKVTLDSYALKPAPVAAATVPEEKGKASSALEILLGGVAARVGAR